MVYFRNVAYIHKSFNFTSTLINFSRKSYYSLPRYYKIHMIISLDIIKFNIKSW